MTKIKTFRFMGCKTKYFKEHHERVYEEEENIDATINAFILDTGAQVVDIKVTTIDCMYHNNGGYNTIDLLYTVIYTD